MPVAVTFNTVLCPLPIATEAGWLLIAGAWIVKREQFYLCIGTFLSGLVVYGFAKCFQRDFKE